MYQTNSILCTIIKIFIFRDAYGPLFERGSSVFFFLTICKITTVKSLSCVRLLATPRTAAYQPPPPMRFSRQEYWSGVPSPSPGRLQSMGSLRVGHDWATSLSLFTFHFHALEKEMATHSSVLAWRTPGTVEPDGLPSWVAQSRKWLKRLSSSSSIATWEFSVPLAAYSFWNKEGSHSYGLQKGCNLIKYTGEVLLW